jgi:hypothetical protein
VLKPGGVHTIFSKTILMMLADKSGPPAIVAGGLALVEWRTGIEAASSQSPRERLDDEPAFQEKAMLDDTMTRRRMGDLEQALKMERAEARKVSMQLLVASFNPLSNARAGLKARHNALVKLADETQSEIERRRPARS